MAIAARHRHECALFDPTDETPESQIQFHFRGKCCDHSLILVAFTLLFDVGHFVVNWLFLISSVSGCFSYQDPRLRPWSV